MARPSSYPVELRQRAVRMVAETKADHPSEFAAIDAVARKLGIRSPETLRKWIRRAEVDAGQRPGLTTAEHEQIKALKKENAEHAGRTTAASSRGRCRHPQTPPCRGRLGRARRPDRGPQFRRGPVRL